MKEHNFKEQLIGDTFDADRITFVISVNGAPLDLTNIPIRAWFRYGNLSGTVVKKISKGAGITVVDIGKLKFDKFIIDSKFKPGTIYYDIEFAIPDGTETRYKTYIKGIIPVSMKVTNPEKNG